MWGDPASGDSDALLGRARSPACPFAVEAAGPGGAVLCRLVCNDGYHAVPYAEAPGCADEYATNDADAAVKLT